MNQNNKQKKLLLIFLLYLRERINIMIMSELEKALKKYNEIDKIRIEAERDVEVKKRIYIGIGVLLAGLGIILIATKKLNG